MELHNLKENLDAAKRLSDEVNLHLVATPHFMDITGKWLAFKLEDGSSDHAIYDTKNDAIRHQNNPKQCCYLKITPDGISVKDALSFLKINRHPAIDTTAPEHVINPHIFPRYSNIPKIEQRAISQQIARQYNDAC